MSLLRRAPAAVSCAPASTAESWPPQVPPPRSWRQPLAPTAPQKTQLRSAHVHMPSSRPSTSSGHRRFAPPSDTSLLLHCSLEHRSHTAPPPVMQAVYKLGLFLPAKAAPRSCLPAARPLRLRAVLAHGRLPPASASSAGTSGKVPLGKYHLGLRAGAGRGAGFAMGAPPPAACRCCCCSCGCGGTRCCCRC